MIGEVVSPKRYEIFYVLIGIVKRFLSRFMQHDRKDFCVLLVQVTRPPRMKFFSLGCRVRLWQTLVINWVGFAISSKGRLIFVSTKVALASLVLRSGLFSC